MSDIPGGGPPPLPYPRGDRRQYLAQLLALLAEARLDDGRSFGLRTTAPDDPTVALLDAWATVADVIAFYQQRIAGEGFLRTATEPGSLLALAQLTGYRPRPGLAASVWLAYSLHPDPADTAVVLPAGLLAQSVPGPGELPQTFETTAELVARPSWNTLNVRTTRPVTAPRGLAALGELAFQGVTTGLAPGDVILLSDGGRAPTTVRVRTVTPDLAAQVTSVTLQASAGAVAAALPGQPGGPAGQPPPGGAAGAAPTVSQVIDNLTPELTMRPAAPPPSEPALNRGPAEAFAPNSDAVPRLVAALHPELAGTLYKALATTAIGSPAVTAAQATQVRATPFGVRMPPRPIFNTQGQQIGTQDWPIGDLQLLSAQVSHVRAALTEISQVSIAGPGSTFAQASGIQPGGPAEDLGNLGTIGATHPGTGEVTRDDTITMTFAAASGSGLTGMTVTVAVTSNTITVTSTDGTSGDSHSASLPASSPGGVFSLGDQVITVTTAEPAKGGPGLVVLSVAQALPVPPARQRVLDLDTTYPGIVPDSWLVIENPAAAQAASRWMAAQVTDVTTTSVTRYGMSGTVTELTLDRPWLPGGLWLAAIRPLTIHAQPAGLTVLPVPVTGTVSGPSIELDGLYAGIEAGRRIVVTGNRAGLPAGATVPAGEPAMVDGVSQQAGPGGDTPHTTLHLAAPLAYGYDRPTVQIYGNVVPARQGATVTEPLTGARPGDPHPSFTLSQAPVLADPAATQAGSVSSLSLSVNGQRWAPVTRRDAGTPPHSYLTGVDSQGRTTIELSGPLPTGTSDVAAAYRTGQGSAGNVRAHQVTQLLSRPLAVAGVDNPLPGSGGSDGDGPGDLRAGAPAGLASLGSLVSVADAADLVRSWAGVGKAHAASATDGRGQVVAVTVAGVDPVPLDPAGQLCVDLTGALTAAGDPGAPVMVLPARLYLIVLAGRVRCAPAFAWTGVSAALRGALVSAFGYPRRRLGQDVTLSQITAVAHSVAGVESFTLTAIALVSAQAGASEIEALIAKLPPPPASGRLRLPGPETAGQPAAAAVAYLSDAVTDTLLLQQVVQR